MPASWRKTVPGSECEAHSKAKAMPGRHKGNGVSNTGRRAKASVGQESDSARSQAT
jgi:hypothetical protein